MTRTELPWLLWDRLVRPFPLAASIACTSLAGAILTGNSVWGDEGDGWSQVTAFGCLLAAVLLWAGWWVRSSALMAHGLIGTAALFAMRSAYIGMQPASGAWWTAGISGSIAIAAGGSYLLERSTGHLDDLKRVRGRRE